MFAPAGFQTDRSKLRPRYVSSVSPAPGGASRRYDDTTPPHVSRRTIKQTQQARRAAAAMRQRAALSDRMPNHVAHCYHGGARDWWIYTWQKANPATVQRVPYQCGSWRCETCKVYDARVNYARFQEACAPLAKEGWCFLTLTVPRTGFSGWEKVDDAYKALSAMTRNFFSRLRRWMIRRGWYSEHERETKGKIRIVKKALWSNQWIGVAEAHRSGWPHMHFAIWSPELAEYCRDNPTDENLLRGELADAAEATGWGARCTLEPARDRDKVASYLMKLSGEAGELQGELAKMTQLPTTAPIRFRRVRAGKNFLPPRRKNPLYTGTLLRRRPDPSGISVSPIHRVKDCPVVAHLCADEETRALCNWYTGAAEPPVLSLAMPPAVVASYRGSHALRIATVCTGSAGAGVDSISHQRDGCPPRAAPDALASPPAKGRPCESVSEKNRQLARQLSFPGASFAIATCETASTGMGSTVSRAKREKLSAAPRQRPTSLRGSEKSSQAPPPYSGGATSE